MKKEKNQFVRVNEKIRISPVRVVKDGLNIGVYPTYKARKMAQEEGLDLVEVAPHARPPVCSIMDYGKYKYQQSTKNKDKKKQKGVELKQIRLRPKIAEHDIETKSKAALKFLEQGKHLQLNVMFKSREFAHKDQGFKVVEKVIEYVDNVGKVVLKPKFEGNRIICKLEPIK